MNSPKRFLTPPFIFSSRESENSSEEKTKKSHEERRNFNKWKWSGCSHNLDFGVEFSQSFLDLREKAGDIQSRINLHNNEAGRLVSFTRNFPFQLFSEQA